MKVRVELEVDLTTGSYDIKFHNQTTPGGEIDLERVTRVVARVMDNVVVKTGTAPKAPPRMHKSMIN